MGSSLYANILSVTISIELTSLRRVFIFLTMSPQEKATLQNILPHLHSLVVCGSLHLLPTVAQNRRASHGEVPTMEARLPTQLLLLTLTMETTKPGEEELLPWLTAAEPHSQEAVGKLLLLFLEISNECLPFSLLHTIFLPTNDGASNFWTISGWNSLSRQPMQVAILVCWEVLHNKPTSPN